MINHYPPINPRFPHMLHGGDYNPDQWTPDVWPEDMRLMRLAHINSASVGIFSWTALEPEEGHYTFDWLDRIMDMLAENGQQVVLATPSGARPAWMSQKYPEVLRVRPERLRNLHGIRHNHCMTSPVYREKSYAINSKLAQRYQNHPALLVWHISNEFGGDCHCELCNAAFREWLQRKYGTLEALNHAWWTAFWSHIYTDWSQIESPSPVGEPFVHGLNLDWKRFVTDQTIDFMCNEIDPLRRYTPDVPITTNLMGLYPGLDYWKLAEHIDVVSWDSYPSWHQGISDAERGALIAFTQDLNRCLKDGKPFMLMESTPSIVNWQDFAKLKRPGMHLLSSIQAVAHGSDTVQYFQWRKSRGSSEKLHGAVVDHVGHEHTRVFRDVTEVGEVLEKLDAVVGSTIRPEVAIMFDTENRWILEDIQGLIKGDKGYVETCIRHYASFWKRGINADIINMDKPLDSYRLVVAPMLYMLRPGVAERITRFVENGGTFVATYATGMADENDLCFLNGFPGPLREVMGIWAEEIDSLYTTDRNSLMPTFDNVFKLDAAYEVHDYCELIHAETAQVLATYGSDFYAGRPALTVNNYGKGQAYHIAARTEQRFLDEFYAALATGMNIKPGIDATLPEGVTISRRSDGSREFVFIMNFNNASADVELGQKHYTDMVTGEAVSTHCALAPFGVRILSTD
ncbi:MAG: beta-galactosidase [Anaerolineae bacterium]